MRQVKNWNELTKNERQAVMEYAIAVGKAEKNEVMDKVSEVLKKELKRLDSAQRYHTTIPLLFRDNLGIKAQLEIVDGRYVCWSLIGRNEADEATTACALLCQAHFSFNESILNNTNFNVIVKILNEVEPRELSSGFLSYNRPKRIPVDLLQWY